MAAPPAPPGNSARDTTRTCPYSRGKGAFPDLAATGRGSFQFWDHPIGSKQCLHDVSFYCEAAEFGQCQSCVSRSLATHGKINLAVLLFLFAIINIVCTNSLRSPRAWVLWVLSLLIAVNSVSGGEKRPVLPFTREI